MRDTVKDRVILLVEDSPDDATLTLRAFQKNGITNDIFVVRDGAEALDFLFGAGAWAHRAGVLPQLVLLDLNLPKVSGLDVLKEIRSDNRTRLLPVIVLTSSVEERDVAESYSLGTNGYVRKSVDYARFSEEIRDIGAYWLALNVPPPVDTR